MPFVWQAQHADKLTGKVGELAVECNPLQGLQIAVGTLTLGPVLGIEVVDAIHLGPQPLSSTHAPHEVVLRQDVAQVQYAPTTQRPVECQARWRVHPEGVFDLEVSTLTPGKWDGLAVQTRSCFPQSVTGAGTVELDQQTQPGMVFYRPAGQQLTYVEFCHPQDGIHLELKNEGNQSVTRYRLFGHDLEKGVILRGRLRGIVVPRATDVAAAHAAYQRFLAQTPNLT